MQIKDEASLWQAANFITSGACNPQAVARSLVEACDYVSHTQGGHPAVSRHPAVRGILDQLNVIVLGGNHDAVLWDYGAISAMAEYLDQPKVRTALAWLQDPPAWLRIGERTFYDRIVNFAVRVRQVEQLQMVLERRGGTCFGRECFVGLYPDFADMSFTFAHMDIETEKLLMNGGIIMTGARLQDFDDPRHYRQPAREESLWSTHT